ncbi:MAG: outer membrane beta-barrel protein, partial [Prevotella pallens]|nr:outer membrane beta-barrel protein [Prevotella pallens]
MSIDRPCIRNLNPFKYYVSRYGIAVGNPELRPSTWWNIRLRSNIEF